MGWTLMVFNPHAAPFFLRIDSLLHSMSWGFAAHGQADENHVLWCSHTNWLIDYSFIHTSFHQPLPGSLDLIIAHPPIPIKNLLNPGWWDFHHPGSLLSICCPGCDLIGLGLSHHRWWHNWCLCWWICWWPCWWLSWWLCWWFGCWPFDGLHRPHLPHSALNIFHGLHGAHLLHSLLRAHLLIHHLHGLGCHGETYFSANGWVMKEAWSSNCFWWMGTSWFTHLMSSSLMVFNHHGFNPHGMNPHGMNPHSLQP